MVNVQLGAPLGPANRSQLRYHRVAIFTGRAEDPPRPVLRAASFAVKSNLPIGTEIYPRMRRIINARADPRILYISRDILEKRDRGI